MKRIICTLLCALMLVCTLTGCFATFDAQAYVQGNLDVIYLNKISDEYLKTVTNSKEDLEEIYESGIAVEAEYFASYFAIDLDKAPEDTLDKIESLYKEIYACAKYEVGEASKADDEYLVNVTVYPVDIIQKIVTEDWPAFEETWVGMADQLNTLDDAEVEKLWCDSIFNMVEQRIDSIGYLEPETISISVIKDTNGVYTISDNDFGRVDTLVINYDVQQ